MADNPFKKSQAFDVEISKLNAEYLKASGKEADKLFNKHKGEQPQNPEVDKLWDDLNNSMDDNILRQYKWLKSNGYSTEALDDYIKKRGLNTNDDDR